MAPAAPSDARRATLHWMWMVRPRGLLVPFWAIGNQGFPPQTESSKGGQRRNLDLDAVLFAGSDAPDTFDSQVVGIPGSGRMNDFVEQIRTFNRLTDDVQTLDVSTNGNVV